MATWLEKLRNIDARKKEQEKLAREMTHNTQAPIESLRGQDPLTDWALGMRERTLSPISTLAGEAKRFQGLSPQEMGMELVGGGMAGNIKNVVGKVAKKSFDKATKKLVTNVAKKTEYELAHELAQRNAALPIKQGGLGLPVSNTAMDRAKAMGGEHNIPFKSVPNAYKEGLLHRQKYGGYPTSDDFIKNDELTDAAVKYSANSPQDAAYIAGLKGKEMPVYSTGYRYGDAPERGVSYNHADNTAERGISMAGTNFPDDKSWEDTVSAMFVNDGKRPIKNYQGWVTGARGADGEPLMLGVDDLMGRSPDAVYPTLKLDNGKIRSRFAAFDPFQRNSANILAGTTFGGVGLSTLAGNQDDYY